MEFRILGPLEVLDGGHVLDVGGAKQRGLLAKLCTVAARAGRGRRPGARRRAARTGTHDVSAARDDARGSSGLRADTRRL